MYPNRFAGAQERGERLRGSAGRYTVRGIMDTLDKLEDSIRRFAEAYGQLREEREHLSGELLLVSVELEQARETVVSVRDGSAAASVADARVREIDARKDELRESVQRIIRKIDEYSASTMTDTSAGDGGQMATVFPVNRT